MGLNGSLRSPFLETNMVCECGCGADNKETCWNTSKWLTTCEFCKEPSNDGVCDKCAEAIDKFEREFNED